MRHRHHRQFFRMAGPEFAWIHGQGTLFFKEKRPCSRNPEEDKKLEKAWKKEKCTPKKAKKNASS